MIKKTGGSTFPVIGDLGEVHSSGMNLRDYFAAKAMAAIISNVESIDIGTSHPNNLRIATVAYSVADAMLAAREA